MRYGKGWNDISFLVFWVLGFSFIRQGLTLHVIKKVGKKLGVKNRRKLERFMEQVRAFIVVFSELNRTADNPDGVDQGYAVVYFSVSSAFGLAGYFSCAFHSQRANAATRFSST